MKTSLQRLAAAAATVLLAVGASAHSGKALFHVIVDTDGAADDLRTLCMLLSDNRAEVMAVVSSDGAQSPRRTAQCVAAMLEEFYHEGIPVGEGRAVCKPAPRWRSRSERVDWGQRCESRTFTPAVELMRRTIERESEPVTILALGALTNLCDLATRYPELMPRIERVVWYDDKTTGRGANNEADPEAARHLLGCGIRIDIVSAGGRELPVRRTFIESVAEIPSRYAGRICASHLCEPLSELIDRHHLCHWDEQTLLLLFRPELLAAHPAAGSVTLYTLADDVDRSTVEEALLEILRGRPDAESRVLYGFPTEEALYADDVKPIIDEALRRHGSNEWRAAVLTNELHGHLGIYATIGVKMGIRAREWFDIGVDDFEVVSMAGSQPPVSCLNDGLQTATGSTLGHGLITIADTDTPRPEATFRFKDDTIRISLKEEYADRIRRDCRRGVELYGADTPEYWQYVRDLAIGYWLALDRHDIFSVTVER